MNIEQSVNVTSITSASQWLTCIVNNYGELYFLSFATKQQCNVAASSTGVIATSCDADGAKRMICRNEAKSMPVQERSNE
jgi:hypothetical protein